jgi:hypothetical protein
MTYTPPVDDLAFALATVPGGERLLKAFPDLDADFVRAILGAAGDLCANVLAPLNRTGDLQGSRLENGAVRTPDGFPAAYKAFAEGGWTGLSAETAHGGQALPKAMELAVYEMVNAANMAFALCPTLSIAAIEALQQHGTERQKALYLPKLVSGEWTGTMQLTEPQAGTDLSAIRTTATPDGDGGWTLAGQKIFITWGDHDCADNIVGMVLARTAGAPEGIKGLSLFLACKRLVGDDGALGQANAMKAVSLEHKLGIHASPTAVMAYEGARAELVGEVGQGLANMFVMMNAARVMVGVQGVGIAERAYQAALAYAKDRRQGRAPWSSERPAVIFDMPDVRRMLMLTKAKIAAARAICLSAGVAADLSHHGADEAERAASTLRNELLTPIAKAWSTWLGVEASDMAVQVHGGMGFIEETGVAQYYRDARIPPIYEGTNGIQANDLVGRKLAMADGKAVLDLFAELDSDLQALGAIGDLQAVSERLARSLAAAKEATVWMRTQAGSPDALAGAVAYLRLMGDTLGGFLLARAAAEAIRRHGAEGADAGWAKAKLDLARFYADQVLPAGEGLAETATAGAGVLAEATAEQLA